MSRNDAFWPAFWTGMAAPVTIYSTVTSPYWAYVGGNTIAQSFGMVGSTLNYTTGGGHGGQFGIQIPQESGNAGTGIVGVSTPGFNVGGGTAEPIIPTTDRSKSAADAA